MSAWSVSRERIAVPEALSSAGAVRVYDADVLEPGSTLLAIGDDRATELVFDRGEKFEVAPMPEPIHAPFTRLIAADVALIAYGRAMSEDERNAWIIDSTGKVLRKFQIGDGVKSILRTKNFLVVTYFDEGVFGNSRFGRNGLSVFDLQGQFIWGWNDLPPNGASHIDDCYAAVWLGEDRVGIYSYASFQLAIIDVKIRAAEVYQPPEVLAGCGAITMRENEWLFRGPYEDQGRHTLFSWRPGAEPQSRLKLAAYGRIRGLHGGRFIDIFNGGADLIYFT